MQVLWCDHINRDIVRPELRLTEHFPDLTVKFRIDVKIDRRKGKPMSPVIIGWSVYWTRPAGRWTAGPM